MRVKRAVWLGAGAIALGGAAWGCDSVLGIGAPTLYTGGAGGASTGPRDGGPDGTGGMGGGTATTTTSGSTTTTSGSTTTSSTSTTSTTITNPACPKGCPSTSECEQGVCVDAGTCTTEPAPFGDPCDAGLCDGKGACKPCGGKTCNTPPGACYVNPGMCEGTCSYAYASPGTACDGGACNDAGACLPCGGCYSPPTSCFAVPGTCSGGKCTYNAATQGTSCDNGAKTCDGNGSCGSCSCPSQTCMNSVCDSSGGCVYVPSPKGTVCGIGLLMSCDGSGKCI